MKPLLATTLALIVCASMPAVAAAREQAVQATVFIDVIPSEQAAGSALLADYVRRARADADVSAITLIEQSSIPNHFILEEAFTSEAARRRFTQQAYVREFRNALFPHLGSPWDERLGTVFAPSQPQP